MWTTAFNIHWKMSWEIHSAIHSSKDLNYLELPSSMFGVVRFRRSPSSVTQAARKFKYRSMYDEKLQNRTEAADVTLK